MNIVVIGDSWGVGEWPDPTIKLAYGEYHQMDHHGLAQYLLEDGHNVVNLSEGGESNSYIIWMLNFYLQRISTDVDIIYVFQTEFYRDLDLLEFSATTFSELLSQTNERFLINLQKISQKYNVKINIIGGCSDTTYFPNLEVEYPGVTVVCQSLVNLLLHGEPFINTPVHSIIVPANTLISIKNKYRDLEFILDYLDREQQRKDNLKKFKMFFWPDGMHPNRTSHRILFDYLTKNDKSLIINNIIKE